MKKDDIKYKLTAKGELLLAIFNYGKELGYNIDNITFKQLNELIEEQIDTMFKTVGEKNV